MKEEFFESIKFLANVFEVGTLFNKKIVDETKTATLNRSLFEIWTVLISNLTNEEKEKVYNNRELLVEKYKDLLRSVEFEEAVTKGTNSRKAVKTRKERQKQRRGWSFKDAEKHREQLPSEGK